MAGVRDTVSMKKPEDKPAPQVPPASKVVPNPGQILEEPATETPQGDAESDSSTS
jgi:hypothetical protein